MPHPRIKGVTKKDVVKTATRLEPGKVRRWSVVVGGTEFPVKQLLMQAANHIELKAPSVTPADFTAHIAARRLRDLGFEVRYKPEG